MFSRPRPGESTNSIGYAFSHLVLSKLLSPIGSSLDGSINDSLEASVLKAHQGGVGGAVGAGDVLAQLSGLLGRLNKHLAGSKTGLLGQAGSLLLREAEAGGTGDQVLDKGEEVGRAGA